MKKTKSSKLQTFSETKRRVVDAIDFRLKSLRTNVRVMSETATVPTSLLEDWSSRIDELESLRSYVKGMVIKVDDK